jgi:murein L,D-transpeptidase YcbB/YkuD
MALRQITPVEVLDDVIRWALARGYRVTENPRFGSKTVRPVHMPDSWHYKGLAADISWPGPASQRKAKLAELALYAKSQGLAVTHALYGTQGSARGHESHVHVDVAEYENLGKGVVKITNKNPKPPVKARTLRRGSTGADVAALQRALRITPDSIYGPATEYAVRAYQARTRLAADGIAGPITLRALGLA